MDYHCDSCRSHLLTARAYEDAAALHIEHAWAIVALAPISVNPNNVDK